MPFIRGITLHVSNHVKDPREILREEIELVELTLKLTKLKASLTAQQKKEVNNQLKRNKTSDEECTKSKKVCKNEQK